MKNNEISKFSIKKLHGICNYDLEFNNNRLILVGENGTGKTTCLKIFYYLVTGQFNKISLYDFTSIELTLANKEKITLPRENISKSIIKDSRALRRLPPPIRHKIEHLVKYGKFGLSEINEISERYEIPIGVIMSAFENTDIDLFHNDEDTELNDNPLARAYKIIENSLADINFIYLPTYRRIESEIKDIFGDIDEREIRRTNNRSQYYSKIGNSIELVEFGMKDVEKTIETTLSDLIEFSRDSLNNLTLNYLGEIVSRKYDKINPSHFKNIDIRSISEIINRIDDKILSVKLKEDFLTTMFSANMTKPLDERHKIMFHYLIKLYDVNKKIKQMENGIRSFAEICGRYIFNKEIIYNSSDFSFTIKSKNTGKEIKLEHLSSGEKQIVSLFSYLYLSKSNKKYFVVIDEPELSLSVEWQRNFLQDISKADFCSGFFAVTHSPFIFDNDLREYAQGINVFTNK